MIWETCAAEAHHLLFWRCFFGHPRVRIDDSTPNCFAILSVQSALPRGEPRRTLRPEVSNSASVCGRFTISSQSAGSGSGNFKSIGNAASSPCRRRTLDKGHASGGTPRGRRSSSSGTSWHESLGWNSPRSRSAVSKIAFGAHLVYSTPCGMLQSLSRITAFSINAPTSRPGRGPGSVL